MMRDGEILIHDFNSNLHQEAVVDGELKGKGLIPRDYSKYPVGCYPGIPAMSSVDMPLIPQSEWSERLRDKVAQKALTSDIRMTGNAGQMIPSTDQNGKGYCWAHSTTSALILLRALANLPYVGLSAYAIACVIKSYKDEGGWGAQSAEFAAGRGVPSEAFWPMRSMDRANDRPETWANAALHKPTEAWVDMQAAQYDRKLTFDQFATCWLLNIPTVCDYNWWSHSVCGCDLVEGATTRNVCRSESGKLMQLWEFDRAWAMDDPVTAGFGSRDWNSWGDSWSQQGMGVLAGSKAVPDGGLGLRVITASEV